MHAIPSPCELSVHFEEALKSLSTGVPGINEAENGSVMQGVYFLSLVVFPSIKGKDS